MISHLVFQVQKLYCSQNSLAMQVVNESLNPVWNQTFDFVVEDGLHDMLILEVWDHDTFGKVVFYQQFRRTFGKLSSLFFR